MGKLIDANRTQALLNWSQIDWQKVEQTVLRLQHRIFMAKVKGNVKGMESLQPLWVSRCSGKMTAAKAYRRLRLVNGQKFTRPMAYTPAGKLVSLLSHSRFHRLRFQQVKGTNSPLDPRLTAYSEDRRVQALFRRALADAPTADISAQAAKLPVRHHRYTAGRYVRNRHPPDCSATCGWFQRLEQPLPNPQVGALPNCTFGTGKTIPSPR
jgi:hypothetical protein